MPKGEWRGGVVGGSIKEVGGKLPYKVLFSGKKAAKSKRFKTVKRAKKWRKKYSDRAGITTNQWRKHPTLSDTIEMRVNSAWTVLFDESWLDRLTLFVWRADNRGRIYTAGRTISSKHGMNLLREEVQYRKVVKSQLSMTRLLRQDLSKPVHITPRTDSVVDNRLSNIGEQLGRNGASRKQQWSESASAPRESVGIPRDDEQDLYADLE
jgi:hypothetical protein